MSDDDPRTIRVEVGITLPSGERLSKVLRAEPVWRLSLDLSLREYINLILQRGAAEAHRWVAAHVPDSDPDSEGGGGPETD